MKSHDEIRKLLIPFVLGHLAEDNVSQITRHLVECQECSAEVKRLGTILESARQTQDLSADEQLRESAKQAVLASAEEAPQGPPQGRHDPLHKRPPCRQAVALGPLGRAGTSRGGGRR